MKILDFCNLKFPSPVVIEVYSELDYLGVILTPCGSPSKILGNMGCAV